ncbi:PepSY domain-containing protein [Thermodesulfovibrio sp. TK110]
MKKFITTAFGLTMAGLIGAGLLFAQSHDAGSIRLASDDEARYATLAKISMDNAVNEALKVVPGKVIKAELENENGYLVYGVEIVKADKQIADVKVDAGNGKILKIDLDHQDKGHDVHEERDSENDREDE